MESTNILNTHADTNTLAIASIPDIYSTYYNNYTITTSTFPTIEKDSNELKINIKKFQIKFNFNL